MNELFYNNRYLFSEIYLEEITRFDERPEVTSSLNTLNDYREYANSASLSDWKSSFIQKVLGVLAFGYNSGNKNILYLYKQGESENPVSVCFVILPQQNIDNTSIGSNWAEKIIRELKRSNLKWGILTDGNKWRIYHTEEVTPYENYLEINLRKILSENDTQNYMIFYEFMKVNNFIVGEEDKCRFDEFKKESYDKIEYIEDELKRALKQREGENGKGVLADISTGYVEYLRSTGVTDFSDDEFRKTIYKGSMLYMFRLLFLFYASARNLLDEEETENFHALVKRSKELFNTPNAKKDSFRLWYDLSDIFGKIDIHYNGGLFDPQENTFISDNRIADYYLCRVIYNMNYYKDKKEVERPISYRDMGVRHLGTLYEGLLEHKLFIAEENIQVKSGKKGTQFIPESQGGKIIGGHYIPKGQVYFGTEKGERKATGSYYTPEYIVDYIVTSTVSEKLKELKEEFEKENQDLFNNIKSAVDETERESFNSYLQKQLINFVKNKILKLSVLDPAMGSGHFLVNASNKIANFITEFLNGYGLHSKIDSSTVYWRRRVVENCIYGVDLNPLAVELAKLSLWILSMAKDAHLSFLNHHLKCGNSLIGARLSDIGIYPGYKKTGKSKPEMNLFEQDPHFKETVEKVINDYLAIEESETNTREDIYYKKELLNEIDQALLPYKKVCDFHTSIYFDNSVSESEYFEKIKKPEAIEVEENNYFNWELEFPEIFKKFGGFDCVVGNPPWGQKAIKLNLSDKTFFINFYPTSMVGTTDIFRFFVEKSFTIIRREGFFSFVLPDIILLKNYNSTRKYLITNTLIKEIIYWGTAFKDVNMDTCSLIINKKTPNNNLVNITIHNDKKILRNKIKQKIFYDLEGYKFNLYLDENKLDIIKKLDKYCKFSDLFEIHEGIHSGNIRDKLFLTNKQNDNCKKLILNSNNLERYFIPETEHWVDYRKDIIKKNFGEYAGLGKKEYFETEKIIIRRTGDFILANIDYNKIYFSNNFFICKPIYSDNIPLEYFLGILNSDLLTWYYNTLQPRKGKLFSELKINQIKLFPIHLNSQYYDQISELVKKIISIKKNNKYDKLANKLIKEINKKVFELYNLSPQEINIILSNSFGEKYEKEKMSNIGKPSL